jgi:glycosyltransferase involved in cell wall biosynthesis
MSKPLAVVSCPLDTYSGYGARARDFVKALIALDKYEVKTLSQRWGNTRYGYLEDHNEDELASTIIPNVGKKPNIWIQCTVPNEFQPVGEYNIGLTAGMETTLVHQSWIEGCNKMDLILTSSEHSKKVFTEVKYDIKDNRTQKVVKQIQLEKPLEVLKEGADLNKYFANSTTNFDLSSIKESFCYLLVGHWMQGDLGQDRKNVGYTIKSFLETFKNKKNQPALILKTQTVGSSILDKDRVLKKIDQIRSTVKGTLPNIYLITGDLTDTQINDLYNNPKVKVMVSHTKGEGFGRPLLEFSLSGKPIIASGWSGQVDFLDNKRAILIGGKLTNVHKSAAVKDMILEQAQWFTPDDVQVGKAYIETWKKYKNYQIPAKQLKNNNIKEFSFESMVEQLKSFDDKYIPKFAVQVELDMPSLELPKLNKL